MAAAEGEARVLGLGGGGEAGRGCAWIGGVNLIPLQRREALMLTPVVGDFCHPVGKATSSPSDLGSQFAGGFLALSPTGQIQAHSAVRG